MTTLPQTSPQQSRLARPHMNGHAGGAGPLAPGGSPLSAGGGGAGMNFGDVLRVLRTNLWLILLCLLVFGAAGVGANYFLAKNYPKFTASGLVQVKQSKIFDALNTLQGLQETENPMVIELQSQARRMMDDSLWTKVLMNPASPVRNTEWFKSFGEENPTTKLVEPDIAAAKQDLAQNFDVAPYSGSNLIQVSMTTRVPDDARVIVQGIVDQHLSEQQTEGVNKTYDTSAMLKARKSTLDSKVTDLTRSISNRRSKLGDEGAKSGFGSRGIKEQEVGQLVRDRSQAELIHDAAQRQLENLQQQVAQGLTPSQADQVAEADPRVQNYRASLDQIDQSAEVLGKDYGPDHVTMVNIARQRAAMQTKLDDRLAEVKLTATDRLLADAKSAEEGSKASLDKMNEQIDAARADLNALTEELAKMLIAQADLDQQRAMLNQVDEQLATIQNSRNLQKLADVSWASNPTTPDTRSFPKLKVMLAIGLFLGLALSLGIAFLRELTDTSVRSPRDIARVGQMNLLGMIPHEDDDPQAAGVPMTKVIAQAPTSIIAEQFRQVRTRLQQAANLDTVRTILITSPSPGDGKTVAACNLAEGLALNGRRILLVDANFRKPAVHAAFNLTNDEGGLAAVLKSVGNFETAVRSTDVPNLDVLVSGPKPSNPTELLESQGFHEFVDRALEEYDHVIFDSGPMLFVSETVALAPRVDGVITVVRARANSRGLLGRLRDSLKQLKADHLGVVLNAVRAQVGGYYNRNIKTYYAYQDANGR